jgi:hypothetical protein
MPQLFNIRNFEFIHGPFNLPENIYIFRAEDPTLMIPPTHPRFFGDYEVAKFYAGQGNRILKAYKVTPLTRVIDIRYIQATLPFLWEDNIKQTDIEIVKLVSVALGLTSFSRQIELLHEMEPKITRNKERFLADLHRMEAFRDAQQKPSWANPIELRGVRCGITDIDYIVMGLLKEIFGHLIDGIIAPVMNTPFHNVNDTSIMHQELILFDPSKSVVEVVTTSSNLEVETPAIHLEEFIQNRLRICTQPTHVTKVSLVAGGSKRNAASTPVIVPDEYAEIIAKDKKEMKKFQLYMNKSQSMAKRIIKSNMFMRYYCPNTCTVYRPLTAEEPRVGYVRIGDLSLK